MKISLILLLLFAANSYSYSYPNSKKCLLLNSITIIKRLPYHYDGFSNYGSFDTEQIKALRLKGYDLLQVKGKKFRHLINRDKIIRKFKNQNLLFLTRISSDNHNKDYSCAYERPSKCTNYSNSLILTNTIVGDVVLKELGVLYSQHRSIHQHPSNRNIMKQIEETKEEIANSGGSISNINDLEDKIRELKSKYQDDLDTITPAKTWKDKIIEELPNCDEIN